MSKRSRNGNENGPANMQTENVGTVRPRVRAVRPSSIVPISPMNTNNNVIPWLGSKIYNSYSGRVSLNKANINTRDILIPEEYIRLKIFKKYLENSIEYLPLADRRTALNNLNIVMHYLKNPQNRFLQYTNEPSAKRVRRITTNTRKTGTVS
jgi:hypothetical protein